jgi:hypothetical protein
MKFLCVPCDTPMKLQSTQGPDAGSMSLVYSCPACGYEMAMLTNPLETQTVASLGVSIGPEDASASAPASKCPFSGMVRGEETPAVVAETTAFPWTEDARARLDTVPAFVRPMAKTGIEKFARDRGYPEVDASVLDEARQFFGM